MRRDKHYSHNDIYFWKIEYQIRWTIYPSIASLLSHRGKYVCMERNHYLSKINVIMAVMFVLPH